MKNRFAQIGLVISLLFSTLVHSTDINNSEVNRSEINSSEIDSIDLKVTMKEMRLAYTQAMKSTSADEFTLQINAMSERLVIAQSYNFSPDRAEMSHQGLDKVEAVLNSVQKINVTEANLDLVKAKLEQVDSLRKEYHKKSKPSVWDLIFG